MKQITLIRVGCFLFGMFLTSRALGAEWTVGVDVATIQEGVNAASSGDTIRIPAGDYYEQTLITNKNLTLAGEPGTVLHAFSSMTQILQPFGATTFPILAMVRSQVVLSGLTFDGEHLGNWYHLAFYGIVFRGSGGRVENCTIRGFRGSDFADARGINVVNFVSFGTAAVNLNVSNSTFADNELSVVLTGDDFNNPGLLRTSFSIEGNTFTGLGPTSQIPNNGLLIFGGAGGEVKANTMSGYSYAGTINAFSSAVFARHGRIAFRGYFPLQPIRYERNTFANSDHHLVTHVANESQVVSNTFQGTAPGWRRWGSLALSGTNLLVAHNQFSDLPIGIELLGGEANGTILRGVAVDTKVFTNQFCRVSEPIRAQPLAIRTQEQGTQITCPPEPARDLHVPADYATIQLAVNAAAPGDTIHIAPGNYFEQLVIGNKGRLTLLGAAGATLHATTQMTQTLVPFGGWLWFPVLGIYRSDVVVSNLTFDGEHLGETYANLIGIYSLGSGGGIQNCTLRGFRATTASTYSDAQALYTDNSLAIGSPLVNLDVLNSAFSDNELSIHLRGDPVSNPALRRTSFTVEGNDISGLGAVPISVVGIYVRNGVAGEVRNNIIRDHTYTGSGELFSPGIVGHDGRATNRVPNRFFPLLPVRYEGNTFSNNDEHLVLVAANDSQIVNNIFHGRGLDQPRWGGLAISGTNVLVANNDFSDLQTGIHLFGEDHLFSGWPPIPTANDVNLSDNWFCNVTQSLQVHSIETVFQEQGTQLCPFRPVFQSINASGYMTMRSWHGQSVTIEASPDLRNWTALDTYTPRLPTFLYRESTAPSTAHRFYRAVQ